MYLKCNIMGIHMNLLNILCTTFLAGEGNMLVPAFHRVFFQEKLKCWAPLLNFKDIVSNICRGVGIVMHQR